MKNKKTDISELSEVVHIWYSSFSKNEFRLSEFEQLLSKDEKKRALKFKFKKDRNCYIISRGILRILLGSYLDENPAKLKFEYTSYRKPYLPACNLKFNISHSGGIAAFAFVLGLEIGVDIESIKDDFDVLELAQNFFSKREIEGLEKEPKEGLARAFYRCWTRKEAFIKAEGSGLSFPLDKFTVSLDDDAVLLETDWNATEKSHWSLFSFIPGDDYIGALAIRNKLATVKYFNWDYN